jgi:putative tryptophan/tyrosine transport system substrate-binding protein
MRRREFIFAAAACWPCSTLAQTKVWRIAILDTATAELNKLNLDAFKKRLRELGYVERQNLIIEYRSADGRNERLSALASELISHNPNVIVVRGTPEVVAVKNATSTIPVVMSAVGDPVSLGIAASLSRPGGNITGLSSVTTDLEAKRVQHLAEMAPHMKRMASLGDLRNSAIRMQWAQVQTAAQALGLEVLLFDVRSAADVVQAFESAGREGVQGVRVGLDSTTRSNRRLVVDLSAKYKLPAIYAAKEFVEDGGLMSYAPDYAHLYSRAASMVDRILKGEQPADLPIELPSKFELALNLKAARALDLNVPTTLLARADEVIE